MKKNKELREKIAEMAHLVWIDWTEYMLNNINEENMDRWERQCKTPYSELSEKEKESDRKIADRYLGFLTEALKAQEKEVLEITGETSDGYHTFNELYEHRHTLFIILCNLLEPKMYGKVWKSRLHSDGTMFDGGWFIAGIETPEGQATYHLPIKKWDELNVLELDRAPEWDGHTADDVLKRLSSLKK